MINYAIAHIFQTFLRIICYDIPEGACLHDSLTHPSRHHNKNKAQHLRFQAENGREYLK